MWNLGPCKHSTRAKRGRGVYLSDQWIGQGVSWVSVSKVQCDMYVWRCHRKPHHYSTLCDTPFWRFLRFVRVWRHSWLALLTVSRIKWPWSEQSSWSTGRCDYNIPFSLLGIHSTSFHLSLRPEWHWKQKTSWPGLFSSRLLLIFPLVALCFCGAQIYYSWDPF